MRKTNEPKEIQNKNKYRSGKNRQAGKNPQEVQKELFEFFTKRGFEYEVHVGYLHRKRLRGRKRSKLRMN